MPTGNIGRQAERMIQHAIYNLEVYYINLTLSLLPNTAHCAEVLMAFFAATIAKLLINEACDEVVSRTTKCGNTGYVNAEPIPRAICQRMFLIVFHAFVLLCA